MGAAGCAGRGGHSKQVLQRSGARPADTDGSPAGPAARPPGTASSSAGTVLSHQAAGPLFQQQSEKSPLPCSLGEATLGAAPVRWVALPLAEGDTLWLQTGPAHRSCRSRSWEKPSLLSPLWSTPSAGRGPLRRAGPRSLLHPAPGREVLVLRVEAKKQAARQRLGWDLGPRPPDPAGRARSLASQHQPHPGAGKGTSASAWPPSRHQLTRSLGILRLGGHCPGPVLPSLLDLPLGGQLWVMEFAPSA